MWGKARSLLLAFLCSVGLSAPAAAQQAPVVAAASDLQFALTELSEAFQRETGQAVRLSFGSSGNFQRQIAQGAPFEMFLSADESYVLELARQGLTRDEGVLYAIGRLVLLLPPNSPLAADGSLEDLAAALEDGRLKRFAIANPDHAPYGKAAREALQAKGLWERMEPLLVLGENVSQAGQYALSGSTQGGMAAYSLALGPQLAGRSQYALIPEELHEPLRQRMVLTNKAGPVAEAFYAYVQSPTGREVLDRYGFTLPEAD
ncbi:molybdate ABC transporter substrate-binding protein [Telmatospirillum sp. J64-1]|uniref:molybdate ABC transporter substrate-binding protein n=1 Tax=Telmatospirillum sp. J64-1 TaxID=2502183 RepID=UPI00115F13A0|nr:molybdate ABC transporter substrate-binding protein [Telmatospirillum sp. J64-1]